jgi:D-alanyl-D-alanine carboxypeptidase (penicillin-binding protein 5/6)
MKKIISVIIMIVLISTMVTTVFAENGIKNEAESKLPSVSYPGTINAKSAVLMDAASGAVLVSKNQSDRLIPASVTKIMTLLLVAEAVSEGVVGLSDTLIVSANAASMGGSQVYLKEGESFTVEEMLKATVIASANDAAVALAELVAGSEEAFVHKMNARAIALGMKDTCFENTTGLDDTTVNHKTSAYDIALMSRELIKYDFILKYSSTWQDSIRDGGFTLTNTNRLVRYYDGCTGLKTGSTSKAGFCISATAERGGMHLIAVIMGAETRDGRNQLARELLDFGFATYGVYCDPAQMLETVPVKYGTIRSVQLQKNEFRILLEKSACSNIEIKYDIPQFIAAPVEKGESLGEVKYYYNGALIGKTDVFCNEKIEKIDFFRLLQRLILSIFDKLS